MSTVRRTTVEINPAESKVNWKKIRRTSDAEIDARIAADPDTSPVWTRRILRMRGGWRHGRRRTISALFATARG